MLVLDKSRAIDEMLWLAQRNHNAVPEAFQRPSAPAWALGEDGRRVLTAAVILRPRSVPSCETLVEVVIVEPDVVPLREATPVPSVSTPTRSGPARPSPRFGFATRAA